MLDARHEGDSYRRVEVNRGTPFAREVIERLRVVYAIEAEIRVSSAEQRLAARRTGAAPLIKALKTCLTDGTALVRSPATFLYQEPESES